MALTKVQPEMMQQLTPAIMPAGSVIQTVNATTSTQVSNATNTLVDTGLTATITPMFANSKILVLVSQNGIYKNNANSQNMTDLWLARNGSTLFGLPWEGTAGSTDSALVNSVTASLNWLDAPATTSALTYKTQFASRNNTGTVYVQYANVSFSFITLMEIKQ